MYLTKLKRLEKILPIDQWRGTPLHLKSIEKQLRLWNCRRSISLRSATLLGPQAAGEGTVPKTAKHEDDIPIHEALKHFSVSRRKRKTPPRPIVQEHDAKAASARSVLVRAEVYKELQARQANERVVDKFFHDLLSHRLFEDILDVWGSWKNIIKDGTAAARLHETRVVVLIAWICTRKETVVDPLIDLRHLFNPLRPPKAGRNFEPYIKQFPIHVEECDKLREVLTLFEQSDLQPNSGEFLAGLDNLISKYQADALQEMYNRAIKHSIPMTSVSYHKFAEGFLRIGRPDSTRKILKDMQAQNINVELTLWNALLLHAGHMRRLDDIKALWLTIQNSCVPDTVLYTSLIDAYFSCGSVDEALSVFQAMTRTSKSLPNTITCNTVVKGFVNNNRTESAWEFVNKTAAPAGMKPDATTYNLLLRAFLRTGNREKANLVGNVMRSQNLRDVATYAILLDHYTERMPTLTEFVSKADSVLSQMAKEGIKPNAHLYTTMMKAVLFPKNNHSYRRHNERPERQAIVQAMKWLDQMKIDNIARTVLVYEILLRAHFSIHDADAAFTTWNSMRRDRVAPDSGAYSTMISGLIGADMLSAALQMYHKSMISGLKRETISMALLNAAIDSNNKPIAQEVLRVILKNDSQSQSSSLQSALRRAAEQFGIELNQG